MHVCGWTGMVGVFMNLLKFFAGFPVNICFLPAIEMVDFSDPD